MIKVGIHIDFAGGYGRGVLRGIMEYADARRDWEFVMPPMYSLTSKSVDPRAADGFITMVHAGRSIDRFRSAKVPVVNVARTMSLADLREAELPTVLPDDAAVGKIAFKYFWERRLRSFGFCGHPTASWSRERGWAFAAACQEEGVPFSKIAAVDEVPHKWIASLPRPCAILAANDRYAWLAIDACRNAGISVPQEIAVLGVDNDVFLTQMARPTLSSIDLGAERIGFQAAQMLDKVMQGQKVIDTSLEMMPSGVITRNSTDVLSIDDEAVAEATQFIRNRASEPISVGDVLSEVAMSRRNLERRFRKVMRRSLLDEIRRVHLERAAKLLRDTSWDIPQIAEQSGFASHVRFSTVFREKMGTTPTAYRRGFRTRPG